MRGIAFGAIVLTGFPFTDLSAAKRRPALVVSTDNDRRTDVVVAFITSVLRAEVPDAAPIAPAPGNGLKIPSLVRECLARLAIFSFRFARKSLEQGARLGQCHVGKIVPSRKQQRLKHRQRRPSLLAFWGRIKRRQNRLRNRPIDQRGKRVEARLTLGFRAKPKCLPHPIRRRAMIPSKSDWETGIIDVTALQGPSSTRAQVSFQVKHLGIISLTPQTPYDVAAGAPADDSAGAGAPAMEIEITPEMIEAGAEQIWGYFYDAMSYGHPSGRDLAKQVFLAMMNGAKSHD